MQLFIQYMPYTYEKMISKARYYFNTRENFVGLHILESYHCSSVPYKYKYELYEKCWHRLSSIYTRKSKPYTAAAIRTAINSWLV